MKNVLLLMGILFCGNLFAQETIYYVDVGGSDKNLGTSVKPYKTLEHALVQIAKSPSAKVSIFLNKGHYFLDKTIVLTPELLAGRELNIAVKDKGQVFLSGTAILSPKWQPYKGEIISAFIGKGKEFDQLYCNGRSLQMARYPNYDPDQRVFNGTAPDAISAERVKGWSNPEGGYVHALHQGEWGGFHYRIKGKEQNGELVLEGGWQNNRPSPMHKEHRFVENIFEELDAPGEWFYNKKEGVLYLFPLEDVNLKTATFEISVIDDLIQLKGSELRPIENVSIDGIVFTRTARTFMQTKEPLLRSDWTIYRGGAILVEGGRNIKITNCEFTELGGNAIFVSRFNRNIFIGHNYIHQIGGNAISFVGDASAVRSPSFQYSEWVPIQEMDMIKGPKNNNYPKECTAYDNLIHSIGTIEKQVAGVQISMSMDIKISHNTIYDVPRSGINVGDGCWGGHLIQNNDVFNTVQETGDHGAFNSWGRDRFWIPSISGVDSLVAKNPELPFLDVIKPITIRNNRFYCAHGWDIDLDDGSSNYRIYNNLALNGGIKLREGYRRVVENNIMVNNTFHPHVWYKNSMDVFKHNIVTTDYAPIRVNSWGNEVDSNFFIQASGLIAAQKRGTDKNSLAGDPLFINDAKGDFRIKQGSSAATIGFKNFSMDDFGVVSPSLREKAERPIIEGIKFLNVMGVGTTTEWSGATIKNIETLGEQSASGAPDRTGVLVVRVEPGSLADKNGLLGGDVIRQLNGEPIANVQDMMGKIQQVMWQGQTKAAILRNQELKEILVLLK